jgi:hypothetical protein
MTPEQLRALLGEGELHQTLDVKTLVIDVMKQKDAEELECLFWENLHEVDESKIRDYFYMSRG